MSELPNISFRVAQAYVKKSERTLARDIDALEEQGLVVKLGNGYLANKSRILAFLPARGGFTLRLSTPCISGAQFCKL